MLILHIGLPKTGTTFLQYRVFAGASDLRLIHRSRGPEAAALCSDLRGLGSTDALRARWLQWRLRRRLREAAAQAGGLPLVVSEENAAIRSDSFWQGAGSGPDRLARRLAALAATGTPAGPLRVLIGIRRQDQWLASRYAESSKQFPQFGQADFDRRMAEIAAAPDLPGALGWLDYHAVRARFAAALGAENVRLLPLERMAKAPRATLADLGPFLGGADLLAARTSMHTPARRRNRLSQGENLWQLRRDRSPLRLDPAIQAGLMARFEVSNRALAAETALEF